LYFFDVNFFNVPLPDIISGFAVRRIDNNIIIILRMTKLLYLFIDAIGVPNNNREIIVNDISGGAS